MVLRRQTVGFRRYPRHPDGDAGELLPGVRGGKWVMAAETQLTRTPQPQGTQALSEQRALSPLEVCIRGNSGEDSITQNLYDFPYIMSDMQ